MRSTTVWANLSSNHWYSYLISRRYGGFFYFITDDFKPPILEQLHQDGDLMYLVRLIYASMITPTFKEEDIQKILLTSSKNNYDNDVTGLLCFNQKFFLQCLEGSRRKVNHTYRTILADPRHTNIVLLNYQEINSREFSGWSMGYVPEGSLSEPVNLRYSGDRHFNPYEMSGENAHGLMLELRESVQAVTAPDFDI